MTGTVRPFARARFSLASVLTLPQRKAEYKQRMMALYEEEARERLRQKKAEEQSAAEEAKPTSDKR